MLSADTDNSKHVQQTVFMYVWISLTAKKKKESTCIVQQGGVK